MEIFLADESVDYRIIIALRNSGFYVFSIADENPGWHDDQVLAHSYKNNFVLITEDKDFGELAFRIKKPNHGIVLLRLGNLDINTKMQLVLKIFQNNFEAFKNSYSVINYKKLRVRKY
ncbi:MAG TPA: DUF5615 family PIN-like protein [Saprospiraceae bacterium]|nr:DUF5615 family PIN-like protein [Saprospiraceae bacterium]